MEWCYVFWSARNPEGESVGHTASERELVLVSVVTYGTERSDPTVM